jgi:hypothetical protein
MSAKWPLEAGPLREPDVNGEPSAPFSMGAEAPERRGLHAALHIHNDPVERLARGVEQLVEITSANAESIRTLADAVAKLVLIVEREADHRPQGRRG